MSGKKAVIFDCWHTLFTNEDINPFKEIANELGYEWKNKEFLKPVEKHLMLEKQETEAEVKNGIRRVLEELDIAEDEEKIDIIYSLLTEDADVIKPFSDTFEILNTLESRFKLGLITNTYYKSQEALRQQYEIEKFFDATFLSYEEGAMKPDSEVFETMIERLSIEKCEALMIGDSLEDDVRAAENAGIDAVLIDRNLDNDYPDDVKRITSLRQIENYI